MKRFEHKMTGDVFHLDRATELRSIEEDGWELVAVTYEDGWGKTCFWKRPHTPGVA